MTEPGTFVAFVAEGDPQVTARPRVTKNGTYTPKKSLEAQAAVKAAFIQENPKHKPDADTKWALEVVFYRGTKYRRDIDNLLKTVMDALTGALYVDDRQVIKVAMRTENVSKAHAGTAVLATALMPDGRTAP